ncbi:uncharacterized protein LOC142340687 [Convolutriloba macropyga]|uniref:uncharacterized protein LOC142340687 n=1 Tax=Convolutriloba macropyga TaxID=536237 RepID=UPI003F51B1DC
MAVVSVINFRGLFLFVLTSVLLNQCILGTEEKNDGGILIEGSNTLIFQIPTSQEQDETGYICSKFSFHFCLIGYFGRPKNPKARVNARRDSDLLDFWELIGPIHRKINWFSFSQHYGAEFGKCCRYQGNTYLLFGYDNGLSPQQYYNRVTDFSATTLTSSGHSLKRLNIIKAYYDPKICANIIVRLGFGQGELHLSGSVTHTPFIFPPHGNEENIVFFSYAGIRNELTFDWFKKHVVCVAQSWICREFPLQKKKVFHQNEMSRRLLRENNTTTNRSELFDGFHQ